MSFESRKPTPRTVWITLTCGAALSSLRRRFERCTSTTWLSPTHRAPHGVEEILAGAHLGRATAQLFEQRELDAGGGDFGVVDADLAPTEVDHERAERERRGGGGVEPVLHLPGAAQHGVAAGGEFIGGEGDRDGIVGAGEQHRSPGAGGAFVGDADQVLLARFAQRFVERTAGGRQETGTDHEDIRRERLGEQHRCIAVGRSADAEAAGTEPRHGDAPQIRVVHRDQDPRCGVRDEFHDVPPANQRRGDRSSVRCGPCVRFGRVSGAA